MTDWRALCAELLPPLAEYDSANPYHDLRALITRASTALDQSEPEELPPDFIDAEHSGSDREMLEVFYRACRSEGGTADEITLRGLKAVLTNAANAQAEPEGMTDEEMEEAPFLYAPEWYNNEMAAAWEAGRNSGWRDALSRWGRPAIKPVLNSAPGVADHITDDEGTRWDRTMDAALWARAFCLICPEMASQEDLMIGWFANAIMAGCDHQAWKIDAERQPEPVSNDLPPKVGHILRLAEIIRDVDGRHNLGAAALAEAILSHPGSRWSPAIKPVPVGDDPGPEDCDGEGRCWLTNVEVEPGWVLDNPEQCTNWTHRLPHWAVPVPTKETP